MTLPTCSTRLFYRLSFVALIFAAALTPFTLEAQINHAGSMAVSLVSPSGSISTSGSGTLTGLACKVTTAVTGSPLLEFQVVLDGTTSVLNSPLYYFSNQWGFTASGTGTGAAVGDWFIVPLALHYSSSMSVQPYGPGGATTGAVTCTAFWN